MSTFDVGRWTFDVRSAQHRALDPFVQRGWNATCSEPMPRGATKPSNHQTIKLSNYQTIKLSNVELRNLESSDELTYFKYYFAIRQ